MVSRKRVQGSPQCKFPTLRFKILYGVVDLSERHPLEAARSFLLLQEKPSLSHPCLVRAKVGHDTKQPGGELGFIAVSVQILISPHECFLNDIFGIIPSARHLVGESVYESAIPFEKNFERRILPIASPANQRDIGIQFHTSSDGRVKSHYIAFYHGMSAPQTKF